MRPVCEICFPSVKCEHKKDAVKFTFCCFAQGGQGKHNHCLIVIIHSVLLSVAEIKKNIIFLANLNRSFWVHFEKKEFEAFKMAL
jgi:hypothetical protein